MNRFKVQPWVPPSAPSLPTCLWKSLRSRPLALPHIPLSVAEVCWWHFCHLEGRPQPTTSPPHQHTGPTHTVHCGGTKPGWITPIPRHPGFIRSQQHLHHNSLQKAHTHRPISTLGQQSFHSDKTQFFQHIGTQGQSSIQQSLNKELDHKRKVLQCFYFPTQDLNSYNIILNANTTPILN